MTGGVQPGLPAPVVARVERLTVAFPGQARAAVSGVSLAVAAGRCVALVGESGSGKSLTARALLGLLPETARASYARLEVPGGGPTGTVPAPARGSRGWLAIRGARAGLVPQDALGALDPLRRIEREVGDALRLHGLASGGRRRARVVSALESAGMPDPERRMRQRSDELSGGLKQRALVASALIADPVLIVADEPTTALDAGHRGRVLAELRRRADAGAGVLLITHDLASVRGVADEVHVMRDGEIIESGVPGEVLRAPAHPFTRELLAASPAGKARGARLLELEAPAGPRGEAGAETGASATEPLREPSAGSANGAPGPPRLVLADVSVAYPGPRGAGPHRVLSGASLEVRSRETVGLVGESGSGKTTLLRVALGLLAPTEGEASVDGLSWAAADRAERRRLRRRIAFVPQDPLDSFPVGATGARLLADALRAAGCARSLRRRRALRLADEVGLPAEALARSAAELSGGQRQRLAIARALARDPEVLLLDEPVSALDVTVQARVLDLLDDLQRSRGTAYLLVSHDLDVIEHMSDRVLRLDAGRIETAPAPR